MKNADGVDADDHFVRWQPKRPFSVVQRGDLSSKDFVDEAA